MDQQQNRKLAAILFADMNERFLPKGKNESPVDEQTPFVNRSYVCIEVKKSKKVD